MNTMVSEHPTGSDTEWFCLHRAPTKPPGDVVLLTIPFAGGNEYVYRPWLTLLPPSVEMVTVQLPGRGRRFYQRNDLSIEQQAAAICAALPALLAGRRWLLYGHSMGARIAFELLHLLPAALQPQAVVLSGAPAPFLPPTTRDVANKDRAAFIQLLREMNGTPADILENDELLDLFLPMLQRDFIHVEQYRSRPERPPLAAPPCWIFGGDRDPDIRLADLQAWRQCLVRPPVVQLCQGDHFFIFDHAARLLAPLLQTLQPAVAVNDAAVVTAASLTELL